MCLAFYHYRIILVRVRFFMKSMVFDQNPKAYHVVLLTFAYAYVNGTYRVNKANVLVVSLMKCVLVLSRTSGEAFILLPFIFTKCFLGDSIVGHPGIVDHIS